MNNRGQALIEFVLILPIFVFILFAVIDFGILFSTKTKLENDSSDIINLYTNGKTIEEIKEIYTNDNIEYTNDSEYAYFTITTNIKIITPGLNRILGNPYEINIKRIVPNE